MRTSSRNDRYDADEDIDNDSEHESEAEDSQSPLPSNFGHDAAAFLAR